MSASSRPIPKQSTSTLPSIFHPHENLSEGQALVVLCRSTGIFSNSNRTKFFMEESTPGRRRMMCGSFPTLVSQPGYLGNMDKQIYCESGVEESLVSRNKEENLLRVAESSLSNDDIVLFYKVTSVEQINEIRRVAKEMSLKVGINASVKAKESAEDLYKAFLGVLDNKPSVERLPTPKREKGCVFA